MTVASLPPERGIFVNRTLNLRSIRAVGYDMDYTLVHYRTVEWERLAYEHTKQRLADRGWPVEGLVFDPEEVIQGLTLDLELGNLVKVTRFGYVIRASHGTTLLPFDDLRTAYADTVVDLGEERWAFVNTLFSLSEAALFAQLVDLADSGELPETVGYHDLYRVMLAALDDVHDGGELKREIIADPDRYLDLDPDVPLTLLDQRHAGRLLLLITNSDWAYTSRIMSYAIDGFLPDGETWRDLFDAVIVSAHKPGFFAGENELYRVVDEDRGLLEPHRGDIERGQVFFGGSAKRVEESCGLTGDQILYVGDHLFGDVHQSKAHLRWRTALVIRELEGEIEAAERFRTTEAELKLLMTEKESLERDLAAARLTRQRGSRGYAGPGEPAADPVPDVERIRDDLEALDDRIAPLAAASSMVGNERWGPLMRAGIDKSLFARQVERHADVYTSRVSNFMAATPFGYLRASRSALPHDFS